MNSADYSYNCLSHLFDGGSDERVFVVIAGDGILRILNSIGVGGADNSAGLGRGCERNGYRLTVRV